MALALAMAMAMALAMALAKNYINTVSPAFGLGEGDHGQDNEAG